MKPERTFVLHSDPGHSWLAVPMSYLRELGIAGEISSFSYMQGRTAYLEEDCDAGSFWEAWKAHHGMVPRIRESYRERSHVRRMAPYSPSVAGVKA